MPSVLAVVLVSLLMTTWLLVVPAREETLYPKDCKCDTEVHLVVFDGPSLPGMPLIHLEDVRNLKIIGSYISFFERDRPYSGRVTDLQISISHNDGVSDIRLGAFNEFTNLKYLAIHNVWLTEILPGTFANMSKLEGLELEFNKFTLLEDDVFSGLVNVKYISLRANHLKYLHPDTFLRLPNIRRLVLEQNEDLQIPTDGPFIKSLSLSHLDISHCDVRSLSVETFANVSALERLDLSNNNLRTVDINILRALPKLSTLYLYGNPLHCDCQLKEVWRWCWDRNIQTESLRGLPKCDTPREMERKWWGLLEKEDCLEGEI